MANILWVEDQFHWIDRFQSVLENADFSLDNNHSSIKHTRNQKNQVSVYRFAEAARHAINQISKKALAIPDIVILDANMSGDDDAGLSLSKLINKTWPTVPIIFLSEHSGTTTEEKVFESSQTKDFIAKHQENIENVLCWRIKALLRSVAINKANNDTQGSLNCNEQIITGDLKIDLITWNVYWHGHKLMNPKNISRPLAPTPRKILRFIVEASPHPLTTGQMQQKLELDKFNYASYRQHIKTLRHSFEKASQATKTQSFMALCTNGEGIVTFGDDGAYCWKSLC